MEYEKEKFQSAELKSSDLSQSKPLTSYEQRVYIKPITPRYSEYKTDLEEVFQPDMFKKVLPPQEEYPPLHPLPKESFQIHMPKEEELVNPWQLHDTYIFIQTEDGLMAIDQHAAHERIIYEKMVQRIHGAPPIRQKLVFPLVVNIPPYLSYVLTELLEKNIDLFTQVGFSIKTFSGNSVVIDEVPPELNDMHSEEFFLDVLKNLQDEFEETEDIRDSLAKSVACKAAIKANKKLTRKEMLHLINDLFACSVPYFCPHGRPLVIKITLNELEKRFKRIE
jgi:DNA mismatch repair protein MutL